MIYLFTGDDAKKRVDAYGKFLGSIPKSVEIFFINKSEFDALQLQSFYSGAALFSAKSMLVFRDIFEFETARNFILEKLGSMQQSENLFVFLEGKLGRPVIDAFKKAEAKIYSFELPKEKKEKFNNFLLANAFEQKDKLSLWVNYRLAVDLGVGLEELVGVLFWKMKDMLLKKNFRKFTESELKKISSKLSYLLPEARKHGRDAEIVFERFLLEAF